MSALPGLPDLPDDPSDLCLGAVLFDMDGTLVESESTWFQAEIQVMAELGAVWDETHQRRLVGGSLPRSAAYMVEVAGADIEPAVVERRLVDVMAGLVQEGGVHVLPGARELLAELAERQVPCALVSATYRGLMDAVVAGAGFEGIFATTVAGDEVTRTKPDPEGYLTAAARLGVPAARCVVIEDSVPGVAAGEAAGCHTVAVPSLVPLPPAPGRTVIESLTELDVARLDRLVRSA